MKKSVQTVHRIFACSFLLVGCPGPRSALKPTGIPICQDHATFNQSFAVKDPQPLRRAGKILVHGSYLLISDPNLGIHILDNHDPSDPKAKAFLAIPGNGDLATKGEFLYADSAVDLLTIRLTPEEIVLVSRKENVLSAKLLFEMNGVTYRFRKSDVKNCEKSGGVVIGARPFEDGEELKRKIQENERD